MAEHGLDRTLLLILPALLAVVLLFCYPFLYGLGLSFQPAHGGGALASYKAFFSFVTLRSTLDCHDVPGGTASHRVREALTAAHARISNLASRTSSFEEAKEKELV